MEAKQLPESPAEHFQLSLRIRHPCLDPDELSNAFKIEPEHCFRAGEPRSSSGQRSNTAVHADSYWLGVLPAMAQMAAMFSFGDPRWQLAQNQLSATVRSLSAALSLSAARFFSKHAQLLRRIRVEGGEATLLVSLYNPEVSSFVLAPEASQVFGDLGIRVEFELGGA
jgi:hypothetical protein